MFFNFSPVGTYRAVQENHPVQGRGTNGLEYLREILAQWILNKTKVGIFVTFYGLLCIDYRLYTPHNSSYVAEFCVLNNVYFICIKPS